MMPATQPTAPTAANSAAAICDRGDAEEEEDRERAYQRHRVVVRVAMTRASGAEAFHQQLVVDPVLNVPHPGAIAASAYIRARSVPPGSVDGVHQRQEEQEVLDHFEGAQRRASGAIDHMGESTAVTA